MNRVESWWNENMSNNKPNMIFGLLQLVLGRKEKAYSIQSGEEAALSYVVGNEGEDQI